MKHPENAFENWQEEKKSCSAAIYMQENLLFPLKTNANYQASSAALCCFQLKQFSVIMDSKFRITLETL